MAVKPIPEGHNSVSPYLIVRGAAEVIDFLRQTFAAEELFSSKHPDGKVAHAEVKIGDSVIMIAEATNEFPALQAMIHVYVSDVDGAYQRAVRAGGESLREPADQFYGDRSAGVKDRSGNMWWISTHKEDLSPAEIAKRAAAAMKQG
jgi:uncharacterized glyoxalase superfamily protein PhnB